MARGKRAAKADAPTERERKEYWRLADKAGGQEKLPQWIGERPPEPPLGAPRNNFDEELLTLFGPFWPNFFPPPHRTLRKFIESIWRGHKENYETKTLSRDARRAWDPRRLGANVDRITRRLVRKAAKPPA
jgi:hypothetical protein